MDRRSFFKILPGLFAVKEIAKHIDSLPKPVENQRYRGLYYQIKHGNRVQYNAGKFDVEMFKKVMGDLYATNRNPVIYTGEGGWKLFKEAS